MQSIKDIIKSAFPNTELPSDKESDEFAEKEIVKSVIRDWTNHSPLNFYGLFEQDNLDKLSPFNPSPRTMIEEAFIEQAKALDTIIRHYLEHHNLTEEDWKKNGRIVKFPTEHTDLSFGFKVEVYYKDERIV